MEPACRVVRVHDLVIAGGTVADGDGGEPYRADVAIDGDRISGVGEGFGAARETIAARGLLVCPGFVDLHTHSDFTLPLRPSAHAKLLQGVTTDCTGNCGFSPFPYDRELGGELHGAFLEHELHERWESLDGYRSALADVGTGINVAPLVGLGTVRLAVMGPDDRPPTPAELERMGEVVAEALDQGAFGASSGLVYAPGGFAREAELVALTRPVAARGRLYATHMRDEGERLDEAVEEALATAAGSSCRLQISHHKAFGKANWGKVNRTLERLEHANADGHDVGVDVYPYTAGCTTLASTLPATELAGGEAELQRRLADPAERARLGRLAEMGKRSLDSIVLGDTPSRPGVAGRRLVDVAADDGAPAADVLLDILMADGVSPLMVSHGMAPADVARVIGHPLSSFGSDGWTMSTDAQSYSHPRDFAAAVRFLTQYVRTERVLELGQAVRKLTRQPAMRLGIADRGRLAAGFAADVTVLDMEALDEVATFADPCRHPVGIRHVLVNGRRAVIDGVATTTRAGRTLPPE